jgi:hypothetical protein
MRAYLWLQALGVALVLGNAQGMATTKMHTCVLQILYNFETTQFNNFQTITQDNLNGNQ